LSDDFETNQRLSTLVSELATNAILHARTAFRVDVTSIGGAIRVTVADESEQLPVLRTYQNTQPTGRGLHFVDALSDRWGFIKSTRGKAVWFEIDPASGHA
jgi:anti-sigma regulatory factor (Ser/Thr protein kinase)